MKDNPVIIITGTRKGIGKGLAEYYLSQGCIVIGCSRRDSDIDNINYSHYCLDIANEEAVVDMFSDLRNSFDRIDALINNAGVASMNHSFLIPGYTVKNILETNVIGTFFCSREAAKMMSKNKYGRIINLVSFAVPFKLEGESIYAASKAAVITLTDILSREYAVYGITVNAISPPAMKTDLTKNVSEEKMDNLLKKQAIHRYGEIKEIASVIDFLFVNPMITGETIYMGGI
ncbi:MAG: SDR family NAD(P)-dependent oxidoreductase [Candidatus Bipolaricaulis sp.]|jgi:3-oxoacyl-[acyl-carrier protein] reductase|nr:SDR family NAD(P)-dependent oxidoreductase [Candidatus Bipolaricaulis sp.]